MKVIDTGSPIKVPVGPGTLGRLFNVVGEPIDEKGSIEAEEWWPIHRDPPSFGGAGTLHGDPGDRA